MRTYVVLITGTLSRTIAVDAETPDDALARAVTLPLPEEWEASDDVQLVALDLRGKELRRAR